MKIKKVIYYIGVFACIVLFGWLFTEIMSNFTWMIDEMDYLLWAILYLAGVMGSCTYLLCSSFKKNCN